MLFHYSGYCSVVVLLAHLTGLDEDLRPLLPSALGGRKTPDREAEEIEARSVPIGRQAGMDQPGLFGVQFQTHSR